MKKYLKVLFVLIIISSNLSVNAYSLFSLKNVVKLIKSSKALKSSEIKELSKIVEKQGTKKLGKLLGKMKLPNEVLEDTFMRIAIYQNKITRVEAEHMMMNLKGIKGFRTTLRKVIGNSAKKTSGHLHELRLANTAMNNRFKVISIGEQFADGIKKGTTDIDLVFKKKNNFLQLKQKIM